MDQSSFAAPQDLSQRTTSFIASQRQGIHQMLLRHLITLMINVRSAEPNMTKKERPVFLDFSKRHIFACQAYPAHTAAGRGWFAGLGGPLAEYAASLRFQTSAPLTHKGRARTSFDARIQNPKEWWSLSGSNRRPEACKATALPAELRPRYIQASSTGARLRELGYPRISSGAQSRLRPAAENALRRTSPPGKGGDDLQDEGT